MGANFPGQFEAYGFHIGMPLGSALDLLATGGAFEKETSRGSLRTFWASVGSEADLRLTAQHHAINSIKVCAPGYRELFLEQKKVFAFWSDANRRRADVRSPLSNRWQGLIGSERDMLIEWAAFIYPDNDDYSNEFVRFAAWLIEASPVKRHQAARSWNWDYGICPLLDIIQRPNCDLATAVEVYLNACPEPTDSDLPLTDKPEDNWDAKFLRSQILARLNSGFYENHIQFDSLAAYKKRKTAVEPYLKRFVALAFASEGKQAPPKAWWGNGLPDLNLS